MDIGRILGCRALTGHPDHGDFSGRIVGGFVAQDAMGDVAVSELRLVISCDLCRRLLTVPAEAVRLAPVLGRAAVQAGVVN